MFDLILLVVILYSILVVMLESIPSYGIKYQGFFNISEWIVTVLFTIEYILRIVCIKKPTKYIFSALGIIDYISTVPKYISFFIVGSQYVTAVRALRLLRVFRILKLMHFVGESNNLVNALKVSRAKIFIFMFFMIIISVLLGTLMYLVEGPENGYNSIPDSAYWTIVTLTTVGYGDISPQTGLGRFIATLIMIMGYGVIAVPTGIVSAEYASFKNKSKKTDKSTCAQCGNAIASKHAKYCEQCGHALSEAQ
ncbi:ion transporter [Arenibacter sp. GZD96]|uniref:ion transporter n=1 Tax=Aurantibrevibacter litoralis TaxID=3106030 RepID=UPI002B0446E8|nr:ion transporter [Arenibacter sp. GZD-96]MEA1786358.1 ion transporter [Arenibacter sp. GZD-96]